MTTKVLVAVETSTPVPGEEINLTIMTPASEMSEEKEEVVTGGKRAVATGMPGHA